MPKTPLRLVLDTNVVLDLFWFKNPACISIEQALQQGRVCLISNEPCLAELQRVLAYPEFALDTAQQTALFDHYRASVEMATPIVEVDVNSLPLCRDVDDQKFIELAISGRADWLITRDKALLRLARRCKTYGLTLGSAQRFAQIEHFSEENGI